MAGVARHVYERSDSGPRRFEMIVHAGRYRTFADTVTELCAELVQGYAQLEDDVSQARARLQYAVAAQVRLQAAIVAGGDLSGCTPDERELLLGPRHMPPAPLVWEADVPLVLVDTYYEPLGDLPGPKGRPRGGGPADSNLVWLRPADEPGLLRSLADAAVMEVYGLH